MTNPSSPAIEVQHLVKRYAKSGFNAVDDVSFAVRRGGFFGLLGPNGAGKTTTLGVLTTSVIPTAGTARITGIDVAADPVGVKEHIAVVPQMSNLDRSLQVREILIFHARYHLVPRAEREARADALLAEFGLTERSSDVLGRFSGGLAQRVMVARALMHTPDVLFLDEPTNNLDPQSRLFIWERIRQLHTQGITIVLTTHDMEEADQLCERIAIMDHGRILALNTPAELKKLIPGAAFLELNVSLPTRVLSGSSLPAVTPASADLLDALRSLNGVSRVEEVPTTQAGSGVTTVLYRIYAEDAQSLVSTATRVLVNGGADLQDLRLVKPSLEDVFIYLTGRKLRA
jgi:ABC-2 type transport system ATP-binding protein